MLNHSKLVKEEATLLLESIINPQRISNTIEIKRNDKYCQAIRALLDEYVDTLTQLIKNMQLNRELLNTLEQKELYIEHLFETIDSLSNNEPIEKIKH